MTDRLTDIAGNTIEVGDTVVYPQMSGRCVQMVLGTLVSYDGSVAQVQRGSGSRWRASYGSTAYRDKRTGKGINPYANGNYPHHKVKPRTYYRNVRTDEEIDTEEYYRRYSDRRLWQQMYNPGVLHDYVEEYKPGPKPVTIRNVANLVKVVVP